MTPLRDRFRRTTATLLSFVLAYASVACTSRTTQSPIRKPLTKIEKGRIIRLTGRTMETGGSDTVRFGHLHSGEIAVLQLWIANCTARPLVLADYRRSCGCTTLEFDNQPVRPGEAQSVSLTFDSRGERGWQLKTLDLLPAGTERPFRLFVEADVE
ncbi:MAG: DUF1573 domain-containing protein [Alistipes senegalensis]|nr:DUF1573 domain-containing protein [Bacteroides cellulosilyticus]MCM1352755.1 DUF1573 domain-containing protein [Alistipes senegalensis]